ncbi:hypothetical protein Gobs01_01101 [Geodermatophilus obscurus DSM 43160]|uniref:Uncharacterized protein n=1 Tax=Geodermatophilus obscurus (strain ATCC 25078 / DSM 43160 / JCM 3152 / CCUG 61914 / KCC A-0152 / KCTC 9177 / NBRC 13315 / NRRL B-3577 / G-20) TaxID=526225 RepID=D2S5L6_GEOOG|nr:hypothetical protein Gobs_4729 [Geodermatophilus obscurus DSM 43160]
MPALTAVCPLTLIAWRLSDSLVRDLWGDYVAMGGNRPHTAVVLYLDGTAPWSDIEHDTPAHALNESLWDLGHPSLAPYRELPIAQLSI